MEKHKIHINWFMLLNMFCGYAIAVVLYGGAEFFGVSSQSVLFDNIVQIIYLAVIVTVPSLIYFRLVYDTRKFRKNYLRPIKRKRIFSYILLAVILWCAGIFVNGLFAMFLAQFGISPIQQMEPSTDGLTIFMGFLGVCVAAPIFEEFFFRGVVLSGFSRYGKFTAIVSSSLLFAIAHGSITIFFLPLIYGGVCAYVVSRTKSIYPGIIMHAVCNLISWLLFVLKIKGNAEMTINAIVLSVGLVTTVWTGIYFIKKIRMNFKWFLMNQAILIKSFTTEITWIGIVLIYLINNILTHFNIQ